MEVINNNNKYKVKHWLAMLYIHGRKFMIDSVFKTLFFNLSKLSKIHESLPGFDDDRF